MKAKRLSAEDALEVFRLCHVERLPQRLVAQRYGVSQPAIAKIARGESYSELFTRVVDPMGGWYVRLASDFDGPQYHIPDRTPARAGEEYGVQQPRDAEGRLIPGEVAAPRGVSGRGVS